MVGCGTESNNSKSMRKKSAVSESTPTAEAQPVVVEKDPDSAGTESGLDDISIGDSPLPEPPMQGWLDSATGYRFVLLDEKAVSFAVADVETSEMALYMDLTKKQREDAIGAKQQGNKALLDTLTVFYPPAAVVVGLADNLAPLLDSLGASGTGSSRRKSLCERKLGSGWHFPPEELIRNAIEDDIVVSVPELEAAQVWLTMGNIWKAKSFDFDGGTNKLGNVVHEDEAKALKRVLCVARDHNG